MTSKKKVIIGVTLITGLILYLVSRKGVAAPPAPQMRYSCSGEPDYICSEDSNGIYGTIAECEAVCLLQTQTIDVIIDEI